MSGDGIVYDIVLGEPYEVVRGWGVCRVGDLISFKKSEGTYCEFSWFLNNIRQGPAGSWSKFITVFRPCNTMSLADMLKECLE